MKNLILFVVAGLLLAACTDSGGNEGKQTTTEKKTKNISSRDYSITPSTSYSDLFLDSSDVENFILENNIPDSLSHRLRSFYNARNYQYSWFNSEGFSEQAFGFWNLLDYYTTYSGDTVLADKNMKKRIENLMMDDTLLVNQSDSSFRETELKLSLLLLKFSLQNYEKGYVKRKELERFIPVKKQDALLLADSLLNKKHKDNKYFEDINEPYRLLKQQLQKYVEIAQKGGWPILDSNQQSFKKGDSSQLVQSVKKYLYITGDLSAQDTTELFNDTLVTAVKKFQERFGLKLTGAIDKETLAKLSIPVNERIKQLLINLERMRWMPNQPEGDLILVNLPEFVLHVMDGKKKVFDMKIVVGKEGHNTMMFTKTLNQIVFSPYWNVPPSIVKEEILPEMQKNSNYLAKENMEIIGESDGVPEIRQLPGEKNSLGKVKFLFPNSYNIYFHDTPAKSLFQKNKRAYSHGCIRLSEPEKMAKYLLRNDPAWTEQKIRAAMNSGEERFVKVKNPAVVFITYYTAWVDENGKLNFRDDIYGHDEKLIRKMFS